MIAYEVNVLEELRRMGVKFEFSSDTEVKTLCPFHEDTRPSCSINVEKKLFRCRTAQCMADGDFASYVAALLGIERGDVVLDFARRYGSLEEKIVEPDLIEKMHKRLLKAGPLLRELEKRAITPEIIRQRRLGEKNGKITIPIHNRRGQFVNVRLYVPGACVGPKFTNLRGRGKMRPYPVDQLQYERIVLCGGELKAAALAPHVNPHGIGAWCTSGGEGSWDPEFNADVREKQVWICMDIDDAGLAAAELVGGHIYSHAKWVGIWNLPLSRDEFPKGDLNDYLYHHGGGEVLRLLEEVQRWHPSASVLRDDEEPLPTTLQGSLSPETVGRRLSLKCLASAVDASSYFVPKNVVVKCDRHQPMCGVCPVIGMERNAVVTLRKESDALLEMTSSRKSVQKDAIRLGLRIPTCKSVEFEVQDHYRIDEAIVSDDLSISNIVADKSVLHTACVDCSMELNETYELVGRVVPHPKTQKATLIASSTKAVSDDLSEFTLEEGQLEAMRVFQPTNWDLNGVKDKLDAIYEEFEKHVTHIRQRRDLHIFIDLAYHSCLLMRVGDSDIKGWVEICLTGDSGHGKSQTTERMARHYGLGERVDCKNATVAGILGGLQKLNDRWFASWGVIPTHDRRLVILEELKGMPKQVFAKLTDMRSSGEAEIPKIERRKTNARTRLIAISNPRADGVPVSAYGYGVDIVLELIMSLEDIRRFDACMVISKEEVPPDVTMADHRVNGHGGESRYTKELCRKLVLWAWTRRPEQVDVNPIWVDCLEAAKRMCEKFTDRVPIVDRGSMKEKIARLSVAVACRTFSTDDKGEQVIVRPCHVQFVESFLTQIYSTAAFGYDRYTKAIRQREEIRNPQAIIKELAQHKHAQEFIEHAVSESVIDEQHVQDWMGWDHAESRGFMSMLVRNNALVREGRGYRKTPKFIQLLKELDGTFVSSRPAHLDNDEERF